MEGSKQPYRATMPRRGRKKRKISSPRRVSRTPRRGTSAEEIYGEEDLECYMAVEVEEVDEDAYLDVEGDAGIYKEGDDIDREGDDINDDEVHRIDTSWIKEEPVDDEPEDGDLHIQEEHNGEVHVMKRKRDDEEEREPNTKYIKTEVDSDYVTVNSQELIDDVKTEEEENGNETDDYWEEDPDDVVTTVPEKRSAPVFLVPLQSAVQQKCAKCAIMFTTQGSSKLPSALQNLCKKCKPNVSITCKICGKHFEHHKLYKRHIRDCSNNIFECATCKERFPTQKKVLSHKCIEENYLRVLRYICPICSEGFEKAKQRNHHKSLHVNYKTIKCRHCKLFFDDLASFQEHMDIHSTNRTFICSTCHLSFDTQAEFFADERRHKAEEGDQYERKRPPEFVYICVKCKHWFSDLAAFNHHDCIKKKGLVRADTSRVANAVPRLLDVMETSDKMVHPPLQIPARKEPPKQTFIPIKRPPILPKPSPKEVAVTPANNGVQNNTFDSAYTCQLCHVSFKNSGALGYHSCLVQDDAYIVEDEEEEEEENSDGADNNGLLSGQKEESPIHLKLTSGLKSLNFSDVMTQAEPNQARSIPLSSGTKKNQVNSNFKQANSNFKHANRCVLCTNIVRHNFEPIVGKGFARYLCPRCMKSAIKEKNCVFKCSKCGQTFPSMSRLHLHLPWHRERTGEEGVFKEPRLACKYLPPREEASTPSPSRHSPGVREGVPPEPNSFGQDNAVNGKEQTAVHPQPQETQQPLIVGNQDKTLLSALLKEPVAPLGGQNLAVSDPTEAGHQRVRGLLRQKITDKNVPKSVSKNVPIRIAPKVSIASSLVGNQQLVINAPLVTPQNLGNVRIVNQGDSLFSQVNQGMFPPVSSGTSQDTSTGGKQDDPNKTGPSIQEYRGMRVKITNEGPRQTIQVLPSEDAPKPGQSEAKPGTTTGTVFSPDQSALSTSIPVGNIACVTAPLTSGNGTVPLTFGGNTLKKTNPHGNLSTLTSFAAGPGTKLIQSKPSGVEVVNTNPLPVIIPSVKQTGSSVAEATTLQSMQPALQGPVLVSLPVDQSQPSETPRGVFLCYSCNLLFMDIHALKSHGCEIRAFNCNLCNTLFDTPELLYNHKCMTQVFTCHMCNKKCSSAKELNQHPCIDTNDIRIGQGSNEARGSNPGSKGPNVSGEKGREHSTTRTSQTRQAADQVKDNGEMDKSYRTMSWQELSKVKDFTCLSCGAKFTSKASLYIHKMKHNMRV